MWCQTRKLESVFIPVAPWLEKNEGSKVVNQGQSVALECSARGVPLSVEWKIQRNIDETVKTISGCLSKFISRNILRSQQYAQREYWAILVLVGQETHKPFTARESSNWPLDLCKGTTQ